MLSEKPILCCHPRTLTIKTRLPLPRCNGLIGPGWSQMRLVAIWLASISSQAADKRRDPPPHKALLRCACSAPLDLWVVTTNSLPKRPITLLSSLPSPAPTNATKCPQHPLGVSSKCSAKSLSCVVILAHQASRQGYLCLSATASSAPGGLR